MKLKLTFILALFALFAQAQIVTTWTADMPLSKIPTGVTLNATDTLEDYTFIRFELELDATTYDNANKVTAFNAIGEGVKLELDSNWVQTIWHLDPADNVTGVFVLETVKRKWDNIEYGDFIEQYAVAEDVYYVRGRFKYITTP